MLPSTVVASGQSSLAYVLLCGEREGERVRDMNDIPKRKDRKTQILHTVCVYLG